MPYSDESYDPFPELISNREQMEYFWNLRQENILPLETAWNEGRFYGLLLKGGIPLNGFQRFGILLVALPVLTSAVVAPPLSPIFGLVSLRLCWVALKPFRSPN